MNSGSDTHSSFIKQIRENDAQGWTRLVLLYTPLVSAWGQRLGCSREACEDLCQEVFGAAAKRIDSFQPDGGTGSFRGWLWKITYRKWIDRYRQDKRHVIAQGGSTAAMGIQNFIDPISKPDFSHILQSSSTIDAECGVDLSSQEMLNSLLHRAVQIVKQETQPTHWKVFWMSAVEGLQTDTIAERLDISSSNVRQIRSRILRRLRVILGDVRE